MSDITGEAAAISAETDKQGQAERDFARLNTDAFQHGGAATAVLALWLSLVGSISEDASFLVQLVAVGSGFFGGSLLAFLAHEWGHFAGARISGAISPVLKERRSFFMFNFKTAQNTRSQFLAMSIGGPTGNWLLVLIVLLALPWGSLAHAALLATVLGVAINVCVFEFPVIARVSHGSDPAETVEARLQETRGQGLQSNFGLMTGALVFVLLALL